MTDSPLDGAAVCPSQEAEEQMNLISGCLMCCFPCQDFVWLNNWELSGAEECDRVLKFHADIVRLEVARGPIASRLGGTDEGRRRCR